MIEIIGKPGSLTLTLFLTVAMLVSQSLAAAEKSAPASENESGRTFSYDDPPFYTMGPGELEMIGDHQRRMYFTKFIKGYNDLKLQPPPGLVLTQDQLEATVSHPDDWERFMFAVYKKCTKTEKPLKERKACKDLEEARLKSLHAGSSNSADGGARTDRGRNANKLSQ